MIVGGEIVKSAGTLVGRYAETARELLNQSRAQIRARAGVAAAS